MRMRFILSLLASSLAVVAPGCHSRNELDAGPTPGTDAGGHHSTDSSVPHTDSSIPSGDITMAQLTNPSASGHPSSGSTVTVAGPLVALTPRLFISQSSTSMKCLFALWVGTPDGGDYSGVEVIDRFLPPSGMDCFSAPPNVLQDVNIGDAVTALSGTYDEYCPSGSSCPPGTSAELDVTMGSFTKGSAGSAPTPTSVSVTDIAGMGTSGARDAALQGSLVMLTGTVLQVAPSMSNYNVMMVSDASSGSTTMPISVSKYPGVGCQRTTLSAMSTGDTVGDITGVLQYSFGQWIIQPRQDADLPGVACSDGGVPAPDGGVPDGGGA